MRIKDKEQFIENCWVHLKKYSKIWKSGNLATSRRIVLVIKQLWAKQNSANFIINEDKG
jgi:hypothetical protein